MTTFEIQISRGLSYHRMHITFSHLLEERCSAIVFLQRFIPFFKSLQSRSAVAYSDSLAFYVTCFLKDIFCSFSSLKRLLGFSGLKQSDALIVFHLCCVQFILRGCVALRCLCKQICCREVSSQLIFLFALFHKCDDRFIIHKRP